MFFPRCLNKWLLTFRWWEVTFRWWEGKLLHVPNLQSEWLFWEQWSEMFLFKCFCSQIRQRKVLASERIWRYQVTYTTLVQNTLDYYPLAPYSQLRSPAQWEWILKANLRILITQGGGESTDTLYRPTWPWTLETDSVVSLLVTTETPLTILSKSIYNSYNKNKAR